MVVLCTTHLKDSYLKIQMSPSDVWLCTLVDHTVLYKFQMPLEGDISEKIHILQMTYAKGEFFKLYYGHGGYITVVEP